MNRLMQVLTTDYEFGVNVVQGKWTKGLHPSSDTGFYIHGRMLLTAWGLGGQVWWRPAWRDLAPWTLVGQLQAGPLLLTVDYRRSTARLTKDFEQKYQMQLTPEARARLAATNAKIAAGQTL